MIHVLIGENSFESSRAVQSLIADFAGRPEKIDGSELAVKDLPDLLMSTTLFADKRLVIIKNLSENSTVWPLLPDWLPRVSDDINLVLVDPKPDKRTSTFKALKTAGTLQEFASWTDRDSARAEQWLSDEAKRQGLSLDNKVVRHIVGRVGVDQWQLASALEKLVLLDDITLDAIDDIIDAQPSENIFNLFELGLKGDGQKIHTMLGTLELIEDPYKLFALLSSQALQLAAIQAAGPGDNPAKDFAIHPFVVSKLSAHAKRLSRKDITRIITAFAQTDTDLKTSRGEPWLLIERTLVQLGTK